MVDGDFDKFQTVYKKGCRYGGHKQEKRLRHQFEEEFKEKEGLEVLVD